MEQNKKAAGERCHHYVCRVYYACLKPEKVETEIWVVLNRTKGPGLGKLHARKPNYKYYDKEERAKRNAESAI